MQSEIITKLDFKQATRAAIALQLEIDIDDVDNGKLNAIVEQLYTKAAKLYNSIP